MRIWMVALSATLLAACSLPTAAGTGGGTGTGSGASNCPATNRMVEAGSGFTIVVQDAAEQPAAGVKVTATRTPRLPTVACPGKLKDNAEYTTGKDGQAAFFNMAAGTYTLKVAGQAPTPGTLDLPGKSVTYVATQAGESVTLAPLDVTRLKARWEYAFYAAQPGLPAAAQRSYTIASAEVATAFRDWLVAAAPVHPDLDFTKERLVALYNQPLQPICYSAITFRLDGDAVTWQLEGSLSPGQSCSPIQLPSGPYWGVAAIPAGTAKVRDTEPLTLDATWLKAAPSAAPSAAP